MLDWRGRTLRFATRGGAGHARVCAYRMVWAVAALSALGMCGAGIAAAATTPKEYVVLYDTDARASAARAAIREAGGRVIRENDAVGLATIRTKSRNFRAAVSGAARSTASRPTALSDVRRPTASSKT